MSENINQIFIANPITSNAATDLMYFGQSPYGVGNDAAMTYSNFAAQFQSPTLANNDVWQGNVSNVATAVTLSTALDNGIGSTHGAVLYRSATAWTALATGTAGQALISNGSSGVVWSTTKYPVTSATGNIIYASSTNNYTNLNIVANATLASNATIPVWVALGNNQILIGQTASTPIASTLLGLMNSVFGTTQGDILYQNGTNWVTLAPGTSGNFLQTQGAGANPIWASGGGASPWTASAAANSAYGGGASDPGSPSTSSLWWGSTSSCASGSFSFCIGNGSIASGNYSFCLGNSATSNGLGASFHSNISGLRTYGFAGASTSHSGCWISGDSNFSPVNPTSDDAFYLTYANGYKFYVGVNPSNVLALSIASTGATSILGTAAADNASAGFVGEVISSAVAYNAVNLTSATGANVTSISLTAGDWDISSFVLFSPDPTTTMTLIQCGVNTTSATMPNVLAPSIATPYNYNAQANNTGETISLTNPTGRINVSTTTTIYLVAQANFAVSTMTVGGYIMARRAR